MNEPPPVVSDGSSIVRRRYDNDQNVERRRADGVDHRLLRSNHRIEDIDDAKLCFRREEKQDHVQQRQRQCDVSGPVVDLEVIDPPMRPAPPWVVLHPHQQAEQDVERQYKNRDDPDVAGEFQCGHSGKLHQVRELPEDAGCRTARGAKGCEVPKGARCQRARGARGREVPEGARCQRALGAKERFPASLASRAVWHPAQSGIPRSLAPSAVWHSRRSALRAVWHLAPFGSSRPYSVLSASIGSTRVALRAGRYDAARAMKASNTAVPMYTTGSSALTPNINDANKRVESAATIAPATRPATTSRAPCHSTRRITSSLCAPSAMRTPNSRVRCATTNETTP